ncbi:MAG TPA: hypothetical protein ENN34_05260 [Deltaproteobacteria bacterium]|nr:hypothetical protein [Deltaproteobacteria bacterium]
MKTLCVALFVACSVLILVSSLIGSDLKVRDVDHEALRVLLFDPATGWECWVEEGDEFKGWTVYEIAPRTVILSRQVSPGYAEMVEYPLQGSLDVIGN